MDPKLPISFLNNLTAESFIEEYWQKKPLVVRNAFSNLHEAIDADTLAGLALEEDIESRIVQHDSVSDEWKLLHGPFTEESFAALPQQDWTLLVQAADQYLPQWNQFLDHFNFLPNWRVDDIMMSYAVDQGSVGPHYDQYDVFLIQASGKRRWQVGPVVNDRHHLIPHKDLRLLANMDVTDEWVLEPGDLLYLPPKYAHHGVAEGECITVSVGFRSPDLTGIIREFSEYIIDYGVHDGAISDADLQPQKNPGWINPTKMADIQRQLVNALSDHSHFQRWFAETVTCAKYDNELPTGEGGESLYNSSEDLITQLKNNNQCFRDESVRLAFTGANPEIPEAFYINGEHWPIPEQGNEMILYLSQSRAINCDKLLITLKNKQCEQFLLKMFEQAYFYFPDE